MIYVNRKSILFDDFAILKGLVGRNELIRSAKTDCDCIGYSSTSNAQDHDSNKIAHSVDAPR